MAGTKENFVQNIFDYFGWSDFARVQKNFEKYACIGQTRAQYDHMVQSFKEQCGLMTDKELGSMTLSLLKEEEFFTDLEKKGKNVGKTLPQALTNLGLQYDYLRGMNYIPTRKVM